ncbi:MAG: hypothetical protein ACREFJ_04670 [Acetobacteraceae bacterium]
MSITTAEPLLAPPRAGLSWAAVFGGATAATAITIMLLALGSGLGLAALSPGGQGSSGAATFTVYAAIWLIIVQWISAFFGGYLAGRLRAGWSGVHRDEVTFRDTASGLIAWAVATIFVVGLASSGAASLLGSAARATASVVSATALSQAHSAGGSQGGVSGYLLDTLFRQANPDVQTNGVEAKAEAGRILLAGATGSLSPSDHTYLVQLVAARTGITAADAGKRVDQVVAAEKQAVAKAAQVANAARKTAAQFAIYVFFSMLIGAFIACVAGAIGGRQRDSF